MTNEVPRIEGVHEEIITLEAGLQLIELLRLFASLGTSGNEPLNYDFSAKIDFNGLSANPASERVWGNSPELMHRSNRFS
ncbi:MAG: hypothetical protein R3E54_02960 [Halioglobus sp.]